MFLKNKKCVRAHVCVFVFFFFFFCVIAKSKKHASIYLFYFLEGKPLNLYYKNKAKYLSYLLNQELSKFKMVNIKSKFLRDVKRTRDNVV